jgi:hypothetical protein
MSNHHFEKSGLFESTPADDLIGCRFWIINCVWLGSHLGCAILAYSVRRVEGVEKAEAILLRAQAIHPKVAMIAFKLACYASVTGRMEEAKARLRHAIDLDKESAVIIRYAPQDGFKSSMAFSVRSPAKYQSALQGSLVACGIWLSSILYLADGLRRRGRDTMRNTQPLGLRGQSAPDFEGSCSFMAVAVHT